MIEPEVVDLQLTIDTLKTSVREAQRNVAELRAELEARRQELAETQVARAQLEGRVREAERRVADSRHVIELQREELAAARTERERLSRSSLQLQSHMKQLQKQLSRLGKSADEGSQESAPSSAPAKGPMRKTQKAVMLPVQTEPPPSVSGARKGMMTPAVMMQAQAGGGSLPEEPLPANPPTHVSVQPGDTLWRIARKYHADLDQLRAINHLTGDRIVSGQALRLPGEEAIPESDAVPVESAP
jgi:LysM repeat protein